MATTIINPTPNTNPSGNNGIGFLMGGIVLVILIVLFFVYALPYIRGFRGSGLQVNVPVPKNINIKVQQTK